MAAADGEQHTVTMSAAAIGHMQTLFETMAHEMIHMHLEQTGTEGRGAKATHNAAFRRFAARVCKTYVAKGNLSNDFNLVRSEVLKSGSNIKWLSGLTGLSGSLKSKGNFGRGYYLNWRVPKSSLVL